MSKDDPKAGQTRDDGTVYVGISPENGRPMYTTPANAPLTYTFDQAAEQVKSFNAAKHLGHNDWQVPTKDELGVLYENRDRGALKGTFNDGDSDVAAWYVSSTLAGKHIEYDVSFKDGSEQMTSKGVHSSLRCIRYG
jgi:hypothetical protein